MCFSLEKKIVKIEALVYPSTLAHLSLSQVHGRMLNSPKPRLKKYLEPLTDAGTPWFLYVSNWLDVLRKFAQTLHLNLPSEFDGVSNYLLARLMEFEGNIIHLLAINECNYPSRIVRKTIEEKKVLSVRKRTYYLKSSLQKRFTEWFDALKNNSFKETLIEYLMKTWTQPSFATILKDKVLYAKFKNVFYRYIIVNEMIICD